MIKEYEYVIEETTQIDNECMEFYNKHPYIVAAQLPLKDNNKTISFCETYFNKSQFIFS